MAKILLLLVILVLGAAVLAPVIMAFEPAPMPGDFALEWENHTFAVPVVWSLCASGGLALLYSFLRR
ncbi:MAG TPA: DUF2905 family protein [Rhizomicrobium sp.]|jgi:hypothetical protein|nr:DUF2905 family protein [Rhizomicrobium sp.]